MYIYALLLDIISLTCLALTEPPPEKYNSWDFTLHMSKHFHQRPQLKSHTCTQAGTHIQQNSINPSVWSDEHCSSERKHFLQWSDERCSSWCTLSLIRLYLDNIASKCNRATSCLFMKELALLWCGKQLLEIIYSFFSLLSKFGFSFCSP